MPQLPARLTWYGIPSSLTTFCNQGPKVWERIYLLQLLILNEYAACHAVARHNLDLVDVYEFLVAFHSNYIPILHRFRDIARYW